MPKTAHIDRAPCLAPPCLAPPRLATVRACRGPAPSVFPGTCSGQMGQLVQVAPRLTLTDGYWNTDTVVCFFLSPFCYSCWRQWVPGASCRRPLPRAPPVTKGGSKLTGPLRSSRLSAAVLRVFCLITFEPLGVGAPPLLPPLLH